MAIQQTQSRVYFESKISSNVCPVLPGHHKVICENDLALTTLLGSCVAACIRDKRSGTGGLNHFLLPGDRAGQSGTFSARYGVNAMEILINDILKSGAQKSDLEIKVFGGSEIIRGKGLPAVGKKNSHFVVEYLRDEGLDIVASDLGGTRARRVFFFPSNGNVRVLYLSESQTAAQGHEENRLERTLAVEKPKPSTVELF